jgi:hypothetical protein
MDELFDFFNLKQRFHPLLLKLIQGKKACFWGFFNKTQKYSKFHKTNYNNMSFRPPSRNPATYPKREGGDEWFIILLPLQASPTTSDKYRCFRFGG